MKKNKLAVLVSSPFQTLCAIEYLMSNNIDSADFYADEDAKNNAMISRLLLTNGYSLHVVKSLKNTLQYLFNSQFDKYEIILVGDYFSYLLYIFTIKMSKYKTNVVYLDDGNSTLEMLPSSKRNRFKLTFYKRLFCFYFTIIQCIRRVNISYFTIFDDLKICKKNVTVHNFKHLLKHNRSKESEGVYIIGTNTYDLDINVESYKNTLLQINNFYTASGLKVFYCPHRRDNNKYDDFCISNGIILFDTKISVEIDFLYNKITPSVVIGFGSSALFSLNKIFTNSAYYNVKYQFDNEVYNQSYNLISSIYDRYGIKTYPMDYWLTIQRY